MEVGVARLPREGALEPDYGARDVAREDQHPPEIAGGFAARWIGRKRGAKGGLRLRRAPEAIQGDAALEVRGRARGHSGARPTTVHQPPNDTARA